MVSYGEWTDRQESTTVEVDGHELEVAYYDEGGANGDADPALLLHGIPTSSYLWREVAPALSEDRRVIVPDMAGYGNSTMRDGFDRSIRAQEAVVDALLDELGIERVDFVGHDLGGGVALRYAVHEPDRIGRLVLSNAVAYDSWPIEFVTNIGLPSTIEEMSVEDLQEQLERVFTESRADEPSEAFLEGMTAPWNSEKGKISLSRNAISTNTNHTTEIDPAEIDAETLLLWGADDEFQPLEYAERLAENIDDAEVAPLDGALHWVMADRPDAYREELTAFLA